MCFHFNRVHHITRQFDIITTTLRATSPRMPPKRHRSSINPATAPLPPPFTPSPSKIPRRKSSVIAAPSSSTTTATAGRRRSNITTAKITPRNSLAEEDIQKPTPYADVPLPPPLSIFFLLIVRVSLGLVLTCFCLVKTTCQITCSEPSYPSTKKTSSTNSLTKNPCRWCCRLNKNAWDDH